MDDFEFDEPEEPQHYAMMTPTMIGHRPQCALDAATRFAEFPRQERINSLRPHLIRYSLFPPRRDPETAPITMEELKGLVRKWKLHHERNFWRNHTSKDDVVNALHAYMRERRRLEDLKREIAAKREAMSAAGRGKRTSGDHEGDGRGGSPSRASALSERAAEKKAEKDAIERLIHASEEAAQSGKYTPIHERMSDDEAEAKYWKKEDKASNARALSLSPRARARSRSLASSLSPVSLSLSRPARADDALPLARLRGRDRARRPDLALADGQVDGAVAL